ATAAATAAIRATTTAGGAAATTTAAATPSPRIPAPTPAAPAITATGTTTPRSTRAPTAATTAISSSVPLPLDLDALGVVSLGDVGLEQREEARVGALLLHEVEQVAIHVVVAVALVLLLEEIGQGGELL